MLVITLNIQSTSKMRSEGSKTPFVKSFKPKSPRIQGFWAGGCPELLGPLQYSLQAESQLRECRLSVCRLSAGKLRKMFILVGACRNRLLSVSNPVVKGS